MRGLTVSQLDRMSEILGTLGLLFFASIVLPYFGAGLDRPSSGMLRWGLLLMTISWWLSLRLSRLKDKL